MEELERKIREISSDTKRAIEDLAKEAISDSESYLDATRRLKDYRWKLYGPFADFILDRAMERVRQEAMNQKTATVNDGLED